jgi:NADH:ubiquinone reductase (H+-translocating)
LLQCLRVCGKEARRGGRVPVLSDFTLRDHPEIFVIGDTAEILGANKPLPGVAPVAKQQGAYVARVIAARLAGKPAPAPFRYRDYGNWRPSAVTKLSPILAGCA